MPASPPTWVRRRSVAAPSFGDTEDDALENLREALELYFEGRAHWHGVKYRKGGSPTRTVIVRAGRKEILTRPFRSSARWLKPGA
jgi:hypothetical protein